MTRIKYKPMIVEIRSDEVDIEEDVVRVPVELRSEGYTCTVDVVVDRESDRFEMSIERVEGSCPPLSIPSLMDDREFRRKIRDLVRRVEGTETY